MASLQADERKARADHASAGWEGDVIIVVGGHHWLSLQA